MKLIDELLRQAIELEGEALAEFLNRACAGDANLRREVEQMLGDEIETGEFLKCSPVEDYRWRARADALTAGVIHRDIKPENVMIQTGGRVKVLDFGIAKRVGAPVVGGESGLQPVGGIETRLGARVGTLKYMSPEQARGEPLDGRTDIFSLGLALYEMIAGRRPYGGKNNEELIAALKSEDEIPPVSTVNHRIPAALDRIVSKSLRKNRDERYESAGEMLGDLEELKSFVEIVHKEKGERLFKTRNANQLLTQFAALYDADKTARIPLGSLWTIWRFAGLRRGALEREVMRKSLLGGLARAGLWILLVAAMTMIVIAPMSVVEVWGEQMVRDGHASAVRRMAFSPDGRLLATSGADSQVIIWDFARRQLLSGEHDGTVRLYTRHRALWGLQMN